MGKNTTTTGKSMPSPVSQTKGGKTVQTGKQMTFKPPKR